jgi:hypothetical protein
MWWIDLEGPLFGDYPGFKNQLMAGLKSSVRSGYFEVESRRTWPFLEEKSRDEVRPDIFGATRRGELVLPKFFNSKNVEIDSNPNPDEPIEEWSESSAKVRKLWQRPTPAWQNRWFLRDGTSVVLLLKHKCGLVARIGTLCRSCRAEPAS